MDTGGTGQEPGTGVARLVDVVDLKVHFPISGGLFIRDRKVLRAVDGVSFSVGEGETLSLVGESGSGKSTIALATVGLVSATSGHITVGGQTVGELSARGRLRFHRNAQIVFQDPYSALNPRRKIVNILRDPLDIHDIGTPDERRGRVKELLAMVGLRGAVADRYPKELSGGQRQRVAIARAIAVEPRVLVCDEPVSALDVSTRAQVLNVLVELQARLGLTYLFIGHDLPVVRHLSDRIAVLYLGRIAEIGPTEALFEAPAHPYTRGLIEASPIPEPKRERSRRKIQILGEPPSATDPPPGCVFHPRCWLYRRLGQPEKCRTVIPTLIAVGRDQAAACHFTGEAQDPATI